MKFDSIELAIEDIRNGKCIIVVDNEDRENEGDLVAASELICKYFTRFCLCFI